jgi:hypothetical protein
MENIIGKLAERLKSALNEMGLTLTKLELSESNKNSVTLEVS